MALRRTHTPSSPTRILGVRIAYVGGQSQTIGDAGLLAVKRRHFYAFVLDANGQLAGLSFVLKGADVVFHALEDISAETRRYLMASCARGKSP